MGRGGAGLRRQTGLTTPDIQYSAFGRWLTRRTLAEVYAAAHGSLQHARRMTQRIFLVEDNAIVRESMAEMLRELAGADVVAWDETEDGAIRQMRQAEWDVAIVDLFLAEGTGLGVARAFAQRQPSQRLYVVTNYATPSMRERCDRCGADGVFDKSTEVERLIEVLAEAA